MKEVHVLLQLEQEAATQEQEEQLAFYFALREDVLALVWAQRANCDAQWLYEQLSYVQAHHRAICAILEQQHSEVYSAIHAVKKQQQFMGSSSYGARSQQTFAYYGTT